ncbi:hydrolase (plasmid) [Deinococcus aetherius]|uniref:Hydrolase n=1 Tax=Deinococcus aetherius TaxID=200252 RepID=A0ABN6RMW0_9DEIO|nr:MBL fold metallo-hydrolase [Deinococcus aetherius]BDP44645.1 hydrolase [Deinococcus aetherius]
MSDGGVFQFPVGDVICIAIDDGGYDYQPEAFAFGPHEQAFVAATGQRGAENSPIHTPYTCLVVRTPQHLVLIDAGAGWDPGNGKLPARLRAAGIDLAAVDVVILTHGHSDHIGAATGQDGQPTFPNARYVMSTAEWTFWNAEHPDLNHTPREFAGLLTWFAHQKLRPIEPQLDLVDGETEVVPGVTVLPVPGHTPGQLAVLVRSHGEQLLVIADAFTHPLHVPHPEWTANVDLDPAQTVRTRQALLERASSANALVQAFHFPFPGLGRVRRAPEGWTWAPEATHGGPA